MAGQSTYAGLVFSILSFTVAIPSAIKVFNWTATIYKGSVSLESPMLYAFGSSRSAASPVSSGGDGDRHPRPRHLLRGRALPLHHGRRRDHGLSRRLHYWWPKISGRLYSEAWAKFSALIVFVGFNLTFFPQFVAGYLGMPRRYHAYPPEFQVLNALDRRRVDPRRRLRPAADLLHLLDGRRSEGARRSRGARGLE